MNERWNVKYFSFKASINRTVDRMTLKIPWDFSITPQSPQSIRMQATVLISVKSI